MHAVDSAERPDRYSQCHDIVLTDQHVTVRFIHACAILSTGTPLSPSASVVLAPTPVGTADFPIGLNRVFCHESVRLSAHKLRQVWRDDPHLMINE